MTAFALSFKNRTFGSSWLETQLSKFEIGQIKEFSIASCWNTGCHGPHSPVLGTHVEDLQRIYEEIKNEPILGEFETALYYKENSPSFNYLIPIEKKEEADKISRDIFLQLIEKYTAQNRDISENTIVKWTPAHLWGSGSPGVTSFIQAGSRNTLGWHLCAAAVERSSSLYQEEGKYLPPYLVAYHEIEHVEDTPILTRYDYQSQKKFSNTQGRELRETLKTQILCDEVYKQVNGIGIYSEVDHGKSLLLKDREIPLGKVVNFYRKLEERHNGSLCEAVLSSQSLEFLNKGGI